MHNRSSGHIIVTIKHFSSFSDCPTLIQLVDLASSENRNDGDISAGARRESSFVRKSLASLGAVLNGLVKLDSNPTTPITYRESSLTRLLKRVLTSNSHAVVIANVCPSSKSYSQSLQTLTFASRLLRYRSHTGTSPFKRKRMSLNTEVGNKLQSPDQFLDGIKDESRMKAKQSLLKTMVSDPRQRLSKVIAKKKIERYQPTKYSKISSSNAQVSSKSRGDRDKGHSMKVNGDDGFGSNNQYDKKIAIDKSGEVDVRSMIQEILVERDLALTKLKMKEAEICDLRSIMDDQKVRFLGENGNESEQIQDMKNEHRNLSLHFEIFKKEAMMIISSKDEEIRKLEQDNVSHNTVHEEQIKKLAKEKESIEAELIVMSKSSPSQRDELFMLNELLTKSSLANEKFRERCALLETEVKTLELQLRGKPDEKPDILHEVARLKDENETLVSSNTFLEERLVLLQEELKNVNDVHQKKLETEKEACAFEKKELRNEINRLKQLEEDSKSEITRAHKSVLEWEQKYDKVKGSLEDKLLSIRHERDTAYNDYQSLKLEKEEELRECRDSLAQAHVDINDLSNKLQEAMSGKDNAISQCTKLSEALVEAEEAVNLSISEINQSSHDVEEYQSKLTDTQKELNLKDAKNSELAVLLTESIERYQILNRDHVEKEYTINGLNLQLIDANAALAISKDSIEKLNAEIKSTQSQMKDIESSVKVERQKHKAKCEQLEQKLDEALVNNDSFESKIRYLQENSSETLKNVNLALEHCKSEKNSLEERFLELGMDSEILKSELEEAKTNYEDILARTSLHDDKIQSYNGKVNIEMERLQEELREERISLTRSRQKCEQVEMERDSLLVRLEKGIETNVQVESSSVDPNFHVERLREKFEEEKMQMELECQKIRNDLIKQKEIFEIEKNARLNELREECGGDQVKLEAECRKLTLKLENCTSDNSAYELKIQYLQEQLSDYQRKFESNADKQDLDKTFIDERLSELNSEIDKKNTEMLQIKSNLDEMHVKNLKLEDDLKLAIEKLETNASERKLAEKELDKLVDISKVKLVEKDEALMKMSTRCTRLSEELAQTVEEVNKFKQRCNDLNTSYKQSETSLKETAYKVKLLQQTHELAKASWENKESVLEERITIAENSVNEVSHLFQKDLAQKESKHLETLESLNRTCQQLRGDLEDTLCDKDAIELRLQSSYEELKDIRSKYESLLESENDHIVKDLRPTGQELHEQVKKSISENDIEKSFFETRDELHKVQTSTPFRQRNDDFISHEKRLAEMESILKSKQLDLDTAEQQLKGLNDDKYYLENELLQMKSSINKEMLSLKETSAESLKSEQDRAKQLLERNEQLSKEIRDLQTLHESSTSETLGLKKKYTHKLTSLTDEYVKCNEINKELQKKLDEASTDIVCINESMASRNEEVDRLRESMKSLERENSKILEDRDSLGERNEQLSKENRDLQTIHKSYTSETIELKEKYAHTLTSLTDEHTKYNKRNKELQKKLDDASADIVHVSEFLASRNIEVDKLQEAMKLLERENAKILEEKNSIGERSEQLLEGNEQLSKELRDLKKLNDSSAFETLELKERFAQKLTDEHVRCNESNKELQKKLDEASANIARINEVLSSRNQEVDRLHEGIHTLERENAKLLEERGSIEERSEQLLERNEQLSKEFRDLQALHDSSLSETLQEKEGFAQILTRLTDEHVKCNESNKELQKKLDEASADTLRVNQVLSSRNQEVDILQEGIKILERENAKILEERDAIGERSEQLLDRNGQLSKENRDLQVLHKSSTSEILELRERFAQTLTSLTGEHDKCNESNKDLQKKLDEASADIVRMNESLTSRHLEVDKLQETAKILERENVKILDEKDSIEERSEQLLERNEQLSKEFRELQILHEISSSETLELKERFAQTLTSLTDEHVECNESNKDLQKKLDEASADIVRMNELLSSRNGEVDRLQEGMDMLERENVKILNERKTIEERSEQLLERNEQVSKELRDLQTLHESSTSETIELKEKFAQTLTSLTDEHDKCNESKKDLQKKLDEASADIVRLNEALSSRNQEVDRLQEGMNILERENVKILEERDSIEERSELLLKRNEQLSNDLRNLHTLHESEAFELKESFTQTLTSLTDEHDKCNESNKDLQRKLDEASADIARINQFLLSRSEEVDRLQEGMNILERENVKILEERESIEERSEQLLDRNEQLSKELRNLQALHESSTSETIALKEKYAHTLTSLTDEHVRCNESNKDLQKKLDEASADIVRINESLTSRHLDVDSLQKAMKLLERENAKILEEKDSIGKRSEQLVERNEQLSKEFRDLHTRYETSSSETLELKEKFARKLTSLTDEHTRCNESNKDLQKKLEDASIEIVCVNELLTFRHEEVDRLKEDMTILERENAKILEEKDSIGERSEQLLERNEQLSKEFTDLQTLHESYKSETLGLKEKYAQTLTSLTDERTRCNESNKDLLKKLEDASAEIVRINETLHSRNQEVDRLQNAVKNLEGANSKILEEKDTIEERSEQLLERNEQVSKEFRDLKKSYDSSTSETLELKEKFARKLSSLTDEHVKCNESNRELQKKLDQASANIARLSEALTSRNQEVDRLEEVMNSLERENAKVLEDRDSIEKLAEEAISVKEAYENEIQSILGELSTSVTNYEELKISTTALILKLENETVRLKNKYTEDIDGATRKMSKLMEEVEMLSKKNIEKDNECRILSTKMKSNVARQADVEKLFETMKGDSLMISNELELVKAYHEELKSKLEAAEIDRNLAISLKESSISEANVLKERLSNTLRSLKECEQKVEFTEKQMRLIENSSAVTLKEIESKYKAIEEEMTLSLNMKDNQSKDNRKLRQEVGELKSEREEMLKKIRTANVDLDALQKKEQRSREILEETKMILNGKESDIEALKNKIDKLKTSSSKVFHAMENQQLKLEDELQLVLRRQDECKGERQTLEMNAENLELEEMRSKNASLEEMNKRLMESEKDMKHFLGKTAEENHRIAQAYQEMREMSVLSKEAFDTSTSDKVAASIAFHAKDALESRNKCISDLENRLVKITTMREKEALEFQNRIKELTLKVESAEIVAAKISSEAFAKSNELKMIQIAFERERVDREEKQVQNLRAHEFEQSLKVRQYTK